MSARASKAALSAVAVWTTGCSLLYDPSQFRTTDAGRDVGAEGLDAFVAELDTGASRLDASAVDAASTTLDTDVPATDASDVDATIDANTTTDAGRTDAARDAFAPDATSSACPLADSSLALPMCTDTPGLYFCLPNEPSGDLGAISDMTAALAVPSGSHRLGVLGNGLDAWSGSGLIDFELVREDDRLAVVTTTGTTLARRNYEVTEGFLVDHGSETYVGPAGAMTLGDVAVAPGVLSGVAVSASDAAGWAVYACPRVDAACNPTTSLRMQPASDAMPMLAYAGTTLVTALAVTRTHDNWLVQRLAPAPDTFEMFTGPEPERLRSSEGELVFADGDSTVSQRLYEPDTDEIRGLVIGDGEPRVARVTSSTNVIGRARESSGGLLVSVVGLDCTTAACTCRPSCGARGSDEVFLPLEGLVDWTLEVVDDDLRVGVFLVGDPAGTEVHVAWWRPSAEVVIAEPVLIASGRGIEPPGVGRSLRTVARRIEEGAINRLEVFAAAEVTRATAQFVFVSGLRLEGCL